MGVEVDKRNIVQTEDNLGHRVAQIINELREAMGGVRPQDWPTDAKKGGELKPELGHVPYHHNV
jgi:hypothetical protein